MGLSFHDLIILKELDDGVREPSRLKSLCLGCFVCALQLHITRPCREFNLLLAKIWNEEDTLLTALLVYVVTYYC